MTLYDNPTPPRRLSDDERALIAEFERMHGVTQCAAATYSRPVWQEIAEHSETMKARFAEARQRRVVEATEAARIKRLGEAGNAAKLAKADESIKRILEMRAAGMQLSEIADQLGSTVGGIRGRIRAAKMRGAA